MLLLYLRRRIRKDAPPLALSGLSHLASIA
jgi:hypothetical protein